MITNKRNFSKTLSNKNAIKENYKVINNHKDTKNVLYYILESNEVLKEIPKKMENQVDDVTVEYRIYYNNLEPIIYTRIEESHIEFSLRYLVHPKKIRIVQDEIYLKVLEQYKKGNIKLYKE